MSGTLAIPASAIVSVVPSVISAGGNALDLSGVLLTTSPRVSIGNVLSFPSQPAVASFFGAASQEAALATNYFLGFDNSNQKPGAMLFAQYNQTPVGAWLRGGSVSGMTLAALQAMTGTVTVTINGTVQTSTSVNLSAATSFSNAAEIISQAIGLTGPAAASFTGAIAGTVLTVSVVATGSLVPGQEVRGAGITAGAVIASYGTGSGGTGTYNLTTTQTVSSEPMTSNQPVVTYDSVAGAFYIISPTTGAASTVSYASGPLASGLALTLLTGATISQGAVAAVPATFMSALAAVTQNWCCFTTAFDPDGGSGNVLKLAFAAWTNGTIDRYTYVGWDTDITPTQSTNAAASFGRIVDNANSNGTVPIFSPAQGAVLACFVMGAVASIDFTETEGRPTLKFRGQTGITPDITSQTIANNLEANGYNYYGAWATADQRFNFLSPGQLTGPFNWIDSYVNQIWLNNQLQLALINLLTQVKSIPYNQQGYGLIRAAMMDPISQAINYGAIRVGVTLSQAQVAEVNAAAGKKVDAVIISTGYYILIQDALPQVRAARGSPPMTLFYADGQSVQKLALSSVLVQ